jgi:ribose transport system substrate-binding protein
VATGAGAAESQNMDQVITASGKNDDKSFCGSKPIVLGIHDGFGINGWSKTSMASVRSEAAKCANVKQLVVIGQGDLQKSISDVNGMVAQGIDALVIIPDFGKSQLPSIKAATTAGVKVVPWAADPGGEGARIMSRMSTGMCAPPVRCWRRGWPRRLTTRATSSSSADRPAIR